MTHILSLKILVILTLVLAGCSSQQDAPATESGTALPTAAQGAYEQIINSGPVAPTSVVESNAWASKVKAAGVLTVGGTNRSALFAQEDPATGVVRGFDAGISELLSRYILGAATTERTEITLNTRESALESNSVDTVIATFSITPERAERVAFAGPYFSTRTGILVGKDTTDINSVNDLAGKTVATQEGSTSVTVLQEAAPGADVIALPDNAACLEAVRNGTADAYVIDEAILLNALATSDEFTIVGEPFGPVDYYGIGVNKETDAVAFIDEFLRQIEADGTWDDLWQVTIGEPTGLTEVPTPPTVGQMTP